ncbi:MAG: radical SAM-associated putative lipoprotein [Bacteroidota bacterium]
MKPGWLRNIVRGLSFTSALFIFQCCYGTPQDLHSDIMVQGIVKSQTSGNPIEGIKVSVANNSQYEHTDKDGFFAFYTEPSNTLTLKFEDVDDVQNGSYSYKDTVLSETWEHVYLEIEMEEK